MGKYDDLIYMKRPFSDKFPPMPMADRAAQFSPFAALTGYDAAISETGRNTEAYVEPDENIKSIINEQLVRIKENIADSPFVSVKYFKPDEKKAGGEYTEFTGNVLKFDDTSGLVIMKDRTAIPIDMIREIVIFDD